MAGAVAASAVWCPPVHAAEESQAVVPAIESLRAVGPSRIESTMVLEASYSGSIERSEPIEAVYVVSTPDAAGPRAMLRIKGYRMTVAGGDVFVEHEDVRDAFVRLPGAGTPLGSLREAFRSLPDPILDLLVGSGFPESMGMSVEAKESGGGEIRIEVAPDEQLTLVVDGSNRLVEAIHDRSGGSDLPDGLRLRSTWSYTWDTLERDEADAAVRFERADRQRLDHVAALQTGRGADGAATQQGRAPALRLSNLEGDPVELEDLRGQVVVLDFWATWCAPCRRSLAELQALAREYERLELPVRFLAVNVHERGDPADRDARIERFAEAMGLELEVLVDRTGAAADQWNITSIPVSVIVDADGTVVHRSEGFGAGSMETMRAELDRLLGERRPD